MIVGMKIKPATTALSVQIELALEGLAIGEARSQRLTELIEKIGGDGLQAQALADTLAIMEDLIAQQRDSIAVLEAARHVALTVSFDPTDGEASVSSGADEATADHSAVRRDNQRADAKRHVPQDRRPKARESRKRASA
jgi:hypothetical protein